MDDAKAGYAPRPFSLPLYLLIVFGLSWLFQIVSVIWGTGLPIIYALNATSMVMVTVGTYIAGMYVFRDGFSGAGWQWGRVKHYLAAIGIPAMMWVVPTLIQAISGTLELSDASTTEVAIWVPILLFVTLIPGFGPMASLLYWAPSFCGWATGAAWREKRHQYPKTA